MFLFGRDVDYSLQKHQRITKERHVFTHVNEKSTDDRVITLLKLGANPFWQDETGTTAIVKAALSNKEPRKKLRTLQAWQTTEVIFGCK